VDDMFQPGQIDRHAVWEADDDQGGLVSETTSPLVCALMDSRLTFSDSVVRNSKDWYKKSQYNHPVSLFPASFQSITNVVVAQFDVHLCAYASLLRIVAGFHDEIFSDPSSPSGLNKVRTLHLDLSSDGFLILVVRFCSKSTFGRLRLRTTRTLRGLMRSGHLGLRRTLIRPVCCSHAPPFQS
jgi:hypothetical protein